MALCRRGAGCEMWEQRLQGSPTVAIAAIIFVSCSEPYSCHSYVSLQKGKLTERLRSQVLPSYRLRADGGQAAS